jgi:hypothetical protein
VARRCMYELSLSLLLTDVRTVRAFHHGNNE